MENSAIVNNDEKNNPESDCSTGKDETRLSSGAARKSNRRGQSPTE
ncbi:MAG: hypothetical protein MJZ22_04665 [Candidatus Saccharibacteria bacterium]|nr:hypothetical protein [Candidatus Saccharibacteria bacterium]